GPGKAGTGARRLGPPGRRGWAWGAHLPFKVATPVSAGWNNPSVEARLQGYGDPVLEAWVSSPPCTAPLEVASHQPPPAVRQGDPVAQPPGEAHPAAQSAAGSAGQAAVSAGRQPASGAPGGLVARAPALKSPTALEGVPFLPSMHTPASAVSPERGPAASAPPRSVSAPADGAPSATGGEPRDTEAELLDANDAADAPAARH